MREEIYRGWKISLCKNVERENPWVVTRNQNTGEGQGAVYCNTLLIAKEYIDSMEKAHEEKYVFTIELSPFQEHKSQLDEEFWDLHLKAMEEGFPGTTKGEKLELMVEEMKSQCEIFIDRELEAYKEDK